MLLRFLLFILLTVHKIYRLGWKKMKRRYGMNGKNTFKSKRVNLIRNQSQVEPNEWIKKILNDSLVTIPLMWRCIEYNWILLDQTQPPSTTTIIITMTTNNGYKDKPVAWLSIGQDKWMYVALIRSVYTTEFNFSSFVIPIRERFRTHSTKSMKCSALVFFVLVGVFIKL